MTLGRGTGGRGAGEGGRGVRLRVWGFSLVFFVRER